MYILVFQSPFRVVATAKMTETKCNCLLLPSAVSVTDLATRSPHLSGILRREVSSNHSLNRPYNDFVSPLHDFVVFEIDTWWV